MNLRDELVIELGKAFEASGHPYSYYTVQTAADTAMSMFERWSAKEPVKTKTGKK
jgi:hypothetical protein